MSKLRHGVLDVPWRCEDAAVTAVTSEFCLPNLQIVIFQAASICDPNFDMEDKLGHIPARTINIDNQ